MEDSRLGLPPQALFGGKKCGLGVFCEQCSEAAHAVMKPTMQRFKRRSDHRHHGSKLKRGTTDYTAKNMTL